MGFIQVFADIDLTRRTLIYKNGSKKGIFIFETPIEVSAIWIATIFVIGTMYQFLIISYGHFYGYSVFLILSFLVFLSAEFIVGNYLPDKLWKRKNCEQLCNIAHYAVSAELITVMILSISFSFLLVEINSLLYTMLYTIILALGTGIMIGLIFILEAKREAKRALNKEI